MSHDLAQRRFGRWLVLRRADKPRYWHCRCDCGQERTVFAGSLSTNTSLSCGCFRGELLTTRNTTHGLSDRPEYEVWASMKKRCLNPRFQQFADYGGRGIQVCDEWHDDFSAFLADMGPRPSSRHTLERKNNDGPYSRENCLWVTRLAQARNKRNNRLLTFNGHTRTLAEWARLTGLRRLAISHRLQRGWSVARALTQPTA